MQRHHGVVVVQNASHEAGNWVWTNQETKHQHLPHCWSQMTGWSLSLNFYNKLLLQTKDELFDAWVFQRCNQSRPCFFLHLHSCFASSCCSQKGCCPNGELFFLFWNMWPVSKVWLLRQALWHCQVLCHCQFCALPLLTFHHSLHWWDQFRPENHHSCAQPPQLVLPSVVSKLQFANIISHAFNPQNVQGHAFEVTWRIGMFQCKKSFWGLLCSISMCMWEFVVQSQLFHTKVIIFTAVMLKLEGVLGSQSLMEMRQVEAIQCQSSHRRTTDFAWVACQRRSCHKKHNNKAIANHGNSCLFHSKKKLDLDITTLFAAFVTCAEAHSDHKWNIETIDSDDSNVTGTSPLLSNEAAGG